MLIRNPRWNVKLRHYHFDTFEAIGYEGEAVYKITFVTDIDGRISSFNRPIATLERPIEFKKREG